MSDVVLSYIREFLLAGVATLGLGLMFNVPPRALLACCITGGIGRVVRLLCMSAGISIEAGSFIGAMAVGVTGYWFARICRMPRTIFTVTGVIPMAPGVPAFSGMIAFASGEINAGITASVQAILIGGGLALGLTTVRVLTRIPDRTESSA
jgi:uncharacterized membrane protein YjjB (DUF3815 family)